MLLGKFYECDYHGNFHIVFDNDKDVREWKIVRNRHSAYAKVYRDGELQFESDEVGCELLWRLLGQSYGKPVPVGCPECSADLYGDKCNCCGWPDVCE